MAIAASHAGSPDARETTRLMGVAEVRVVHPDAGLRFVTRVVPLEFLKRTSRYAKSFCQLFFATLAVAVNKVVFAMPDTLTCWLMVVGL